MKSSLSCVLRLILPPELVFLYVVLVLLQCLNRRRPFLFPSESCAKAQWCLPQTQALPSQCSCLFLFLLPPLLVRAEISIFAHWQCGKCGSVALQDCCCFSHYIAMLGSESWSLVNVASSCSVCFSWFLVSTASFHQLL